MLVEYSFITTLEAIDAMRLASEFLTGRGFLVERSNAFALDGGGWNALEVRLEKRKGKARTKTAVDLKQVVRLEWDRGRISMAALSLLAPGINTGLSTRPSRDKTFEADQRQLLLAIARAMELVVGGQRPDQGAAEWDRAEQEVTAQAATKRRRNQPLIIFVVILAVIAIIVAIIGIATSPRY